MLTDWTSENGIKAIGKINPPCPEADGEEAMRILRDLAREWLGAHGWEIRYGHNGMTVGKCDLAKSAWYGYRRQTSERLSLCQHANYDYDACLIAAINAAGE